MLRATRREYLKAYRAHRPECRPLATAAQKMTALYTIECGLKALIMKEQNVESTDQLASDKQIGHDVVAGLRHLKAPVELYQLGRLNIMTNHSRSPQEVVRAGEVHEALRYGIPTTREAEISGEIRKILNWVETRLQ